MRPAARALSLTDRASAGVLLAASTQGLEVHQVPYEQENATEHACRSTEEVTVTLVLIAVLTLPLVAVLTLTLVAVLTLALFSRLLFCVPIVILRRVTGLSVVVAVMVSFMAAHL